MALLRRHEFDPSSRQLLLHNNPGQVIHTYVPLSLSSIVYFRVKVGARRTYCVMHWPCIHSLAALISVWLRA